LLFTVPTGLIRILNRDLTASGIPKIDERGYSVDVHALRHSFGTLLSTSGVAPRVAQAAMRHSDLRLTMNVYTDPKLLDIHGALNSLPSLDSAIELNQEKATGTNDNKPSIMFPNMSPETCPILSKRDNPEQNREANKDTLNKQKRRENMCSPGVSLVGDIGLEPTTSTMSTWRSSQLS
jgi:hypothetical protein